MHASTRTVTGLGVSFAGMDRETPTIMAMAYMLLYSQNPESTILECPNP